MPHILDIIIALPLVWGAYKGFKKGLIIEVTTLIALTQLGRSHSEALGRRDFYFSVVHYIFSFDLLGIGT